MEKTAREWLMELKPEHRDLAIEGFEKFNITEKDKKFTSLGFALRLSFSWS